MGLEAPKPSAVKVCRLLMQGALFLAVMVLSGCTASHYRKSADKAATRILAQKAPMVPNVGTNLAIETVAPESLEGASVVKEKDPALGVDAATEVGARRLSLEKSLAIAVKQSREYQTQKEVLYLAALSLDLARHNFTPIFSGTGNSTAQNQPKDVTRAIDDLTGTQTTLVQANTVVVQQYNASGRGALGMNVLLASGARLANSFTVDFLKFINGSKSTFIRSSLAGSLTQPLLRGAGFKVTMENLTQAERNMLYALRDFAVYRKDFSVRIAQGYYGLLQGRDAVRNNYRGYLNFKQDAERGRAFAEEGRLAQADLGQIEQALLSAEANWVNSIRSYKQNLDQFKILLGLPTDASLVLDDQELENLRIMDYSMPVDDALKVAQAARLDLINAKERMEDAKRKVPITANALMPGLDLVLSGNVDSTPGNNNPSSLDLERARGSVGLNMDLPLERTPQRNAYRSAIIDRERAVRDYQLRVDQVKLQIYDDLRGLEQARRNYEISEGSVRLAERRVEEQFLRAELGRSTTRDQVEAQNALISSRNQRTQALVSHTMSRLQMWRDLGILYIKDNGQWEDAKNAKLN